jgi:hypothetical protein
VEVANFKLQTKLNEQDALLATIVASISRCRKELEKVLKDGKE